MSEVKLIGGWTGFCLPCGDDRPLALTETGPRGVRAWRGKVDPDSRVLRLTCRVCGKWQLVPRSEQDDPEIEATDAAPDLVHAAELHASELADELHAADLADEIFGEDDVAAAVEVVGELDDDADEPAAAFGPAAAYEPAAAFVPAAAYEPAPAYEPEAAPPLSYALPTEPAPAYPAPSVPLPVPQVSQPDPAMSHYRLAPPAATPYNAPAVPSPRVAPADLDNADLSTVLELLSQGLELSGPGSVERG